MGGMNEQDLTKLARENVEAYSAGDWTRLKASLAPDVVYDEVGSQRRIQGADEMVEAYRDGSKPYRMARERLGPFLRAATPSPSR